MHLTAKGCARRFSRFINQIDPSRIESGWIAHTITQSFLHECAVYNQARSINMEIRRAKLQARMDALKPPYAMLQFHGEVVRLTKSQFDQALIDSAHCYCGSCLVCHVANYYKETSRK